MAGKPKMILVMRHAEKPEDPDEPNLTKKGYVRAEKLAEYIPDKFGSPGFIFAAAITRHSARPYETVRPLSKATGVGIDATIADNDYGALAKELLTKKEICGQAGRGLLAPWQHPTHDALPRCQEGRLSQPLGSHGFQPDPPGRVFR